MIDWRKILGFVALAIASAGPLPLWWHQALCHSHASCTSTCQVQVNCNPIDADCHTHEDCGESQSEPNSDCSSQACDETLTVHTSVESGSGVHECWVCFQLSQSASSGFSIACASGQLFSFESYISCRQFLSATLCGLYSPRGPPALGI